MSTTADTLTDYQITTLGTEARRAGDYVTAAWCMILEGQTDDLETAEPGTDYADSWAEYLAGRIDEDGLRERVAEIIAEAEAQDDSDDDWT